MTPARRPAERADLLQHLAERMDAIEAAIAALREMLAGRLTALEAAVARVPNIEERLGELEKVRARGEGAAWAVRVGWVLFTAATAIGSAYFFRR